MYLNTEDGGKPGEGEEEQRRETGKGGGRQESRVTKWTSIRGTIKDEENEPDEERTPECMGALKIFEVEMS